MVIKEQDIFNYVFSPGRLSAEKIKAIKENLDLAETVNFYRNVQAESKELLSRSVKEKMASSIPAYTLINMVQLFPLPETGGKNPVGKRLAADSESRHLISKLMSKTFVDEDKEYMIKVINHQSTTKIFVFSAKNDIVKNFDIIIEPKNNRYHFNDNSRPFMIDEEIEIESIRLELKGGSSKN